MRCRICHRELREPLSVELGIGPVCRAGRNTIDQEEFDFMGKEKAIKGFGDVVCKRTESGIETNVPQRIWKHICYPNGGNMQWGYSGSGPADFALNILSCYIGQEAAEKNGLYQSFKAQFIATMPHEGGTIRRENVLAWLEGRV